MKANPSVDVQDAEANTAKSLDRLEALTGAELAAMLFDTSDNGVGLESLDEWGVPRDASFGRPWMRNTGDES